MQKQMEIAGSEVWGLGYESVGLKLPQFKLCENLLSLISG
jgi:hypothetical protein